MFCSFGFNLEEYISKTNNQSGQVFLSKFPYEEYLEQIDIRNMQIIEKHRVLLNQNGRDGNRFLISLFEKYLKATSFDVNDLDGLKMQLKISENTLQFQLKVDTGENKTYEIIGYLLFDRVASVVQAGVKQGRLNKNSEDVKYLISKLTENQYIIDLPVSTFEKLLFHIRKGNWKYIYDRIKNVYLWQFIGLVTLVLFVFLVVIYIAIKKMKNRKFRHSK